MGVATSSSMPLFTESTPFVSVIIPTLNRRDILIPTLISLSKQDYPRFEVLIIDQSDVPFSSDELSFLSPLKIFYHHLTQKSLPHARNYGAVKAQGDILLYIDDDVDIQNPFFIAMHARHYQDPTIGLIGGRVINPWDLQKTHFGKTYRVHSLLIPSGAFNSTTPSFTNSVPGANFSCRKNLYLEIRGFDEGLLGNALFEETEFSLRASRHGSRIFFDPEAYLHHLAIPSGGTRNSVQNWQQRIYWFYHNYTYFFLKHGPRWFLPFFFLFLLTRSPYYMVKYRSFSFLTHSCLRGTFFGFRHFLRTKPSSQFGSL